jgi:hypothetical protein
LALHRSVFVTQEPARLWEIHLRIPTHGPVAVSCKHGGESVSNGVARTSTPGDALRLIESLLTTFNEGDQLFITARASDSNLSMWRTESKGTGLYWCASVLAKLWRTTTQAARPALPRRQAHRIP